MSLVSELRAVLGPHLLHERETLLPFLTDASYFTGKPPIAVAIPGTPDEVSRVVTICHSYGVKVVTRGAGTSLTGSSVPVYDSVVLSMMRLNSVIAIEPGDRYVIAEAGVRLNELNTRLAEIGFLYPPDPASSMAATVGGTVSTNAGGLRTIAYGSTKDWVLGLEVVLPDGRMVRTGGMNVTRPFGYDTTSLFVGSEGTLGVVTRAILRIAPLPEEIRMVIGHFSGALEASRAAGEIRGSGLPVLMAEFLDRLTMDAVSNALSINFPENSNYMLMVVIQSTHESIGRLLSDAFQILKKWNPVSSKIITDPNEEADMYRARRAIGISLLRLKESDAQSLITLDVVVPPSELPPTLMEISSRASEYGIKCLMAGHIGDGNIHPALFADLSDPGIKEKADRLMMEIGMIAVSHNGSVSGEHGIGLEKKEHLREELSRIGSARNIIVMKNLKKSIDRKYQLNPGKVFD